MGEQGFGVAAEAPAAGIGLGQRIERGLRRLLVEAFGENRLDRAIARAAEGQRPDAGSPPGGRRRRSWPSGRWIWLGVYSR